jgi:hypothetical protein
MMKVTGLRVRHVSDEEREKERRKHITLVLI